MVIRKKKKCCQGAKFAQRIRDSVELSHPTHPLLSPTPLRTYGVENDYSVTHWKSGYTQRIKECGVDSIQTCKNNPRVFKKLSGCDHLCCC